VEQPLDFVVHGFPKGGAEINTERRERNALPYGQKKRERILCNSGPPAAVMYFDFYPLPVGKSKRGRRPPLCRFKGKDT